MADNTDGKQRRHQSGKRRHHDSATDREHRRVLNLSHLTTSHRRDYPAENFVVKKFCLRIYYPAKNVNGLLFWFFYQIITNVI